MNRQRDPFQKALVSLRVGASEGRIAPGAPIIIADEARALGLSTTPVREALCWLGGEGLVERGAAGGFFAPRLEATALAQRYRFRQLCLSETIRRTGGDLPSAYVQQTAVGRLNELWFWKVRSSGDVALLAAFKTVQAHLVRFASVEAELFVDLEVEAEAAIESFSAGDLSGIDAYHRRRTEAAPLLVLGAETDARPPSPPGSLR